MTRSRQFADDNVRQNSEAAVPRWIHFVGDPIPTDLDQARARLGAKGLSLALLAQAKLNVPPAFTIATSACQRYYEDGRRWPDGLWLEVEAALERLALLTGQRFGDAERPLTVAVRSGAAESMPGLLTTVLDCGLTPSDDPRSELCQAITSVFDSWQSAEARRFRELRGCSSAEGTAVTIQAMFAAEVSGIAFSHSPHDRQRIHYVVETVCGSGRPLVAGQATPVRFAVDRATLQLSPSDGATMVEGPFADFVARGLPHLCRSLPAIEALWGGPVDVEFGYATGQLAYFQARPWEQPVAESSFDQAVAVERARLIEWKRQKRDFWVRHNLGQTLPFPTPLTWDLWRSFFTGKRGNGTLYRLLGYRPSRRVCRDGFLELIAGRIYADPDRMPDMFCAGYPLVFNRDLLLRDPNALDRGPTEFDAEKLDPWFLLRWPFVCWTMLRAAVLCGRHARDAARLFKEHTLPAVRTFVERERQINLPSLSVPELIEVFHRRRSAVFDKFAPQTLLPGTLGAAAWQAFERRLSSSIGESDARPLTGELISHVPDPIGGRQRTLLTRIACDASAVDAFCGEFGHRGPGEMDLSSWRWRERPDALLSLAAKCSGANSAAPAPRLPDEILNGIQQRTGRRRAAELRKLFDTARSLLPYRQTGKNELLRAYDLLRDVLLELSQRTGLNAGIHYLTVAELDSLAERSDWRRVIDERCAHHRACRKLYVPDVLEVGDDLSEFGLPPRFDDGETLIGLPVSDGRAAGEVCLLHDGGPLATPSGGVVVAAAVDPQSLPWLVDVAALVLEQGGILSHVAVLARQLGIPAVIVSGITQRVKTGDVLEVDGHRGAVRLKPPG